MGSRQDGAGGASLRTPPVGNVLNRLLGIVSEVSDNAEEPRLWTSAPFGYFQGVKTGSAAFPFQTTPIGKMLNTPLGIELEVSDILTAPLACKRSRQDGLSGTTFRTTTRVKYLNTLRV
ncbi:MAG: hypothetical protein LBL06_04285 [Treponema sp.]|jgi:hypothetical protein|nr:hypothetical protein [Treponema sp.]